jgi:hypothetical protein
MAEDLNPPFYVTPSEELELRIKADQLAISPLVEAPTDFDAFHRSLYVPSAITELARRAANLRFSTWQVEAIRASIHGGLLREILELKAEADDTHPPYIRVACTGKGDYDHLAEKRGWDEPEAAFLSTTHEGDYGSPLILEIWPAGHYSPIHSHGDTTGIVYCMAGQVDVMVYDKLAWDATKLGLLTLTPGQCAWLDPSRFCVHKVACRQPEGNFGATFHVYLNQNELPLLDATPEPHTRDIFQMVNEKTHAIEDFVTYSDLSWRYLRREMAEFATKWGG